MLEQLNLFASLAPEKIVPEPKPERRLTPPPFVHELQPEPLSVAEEPAPVEQPVEKSQADTTKKETARSSRGRKSIRELSLEAAFVNIPEDAVLYSKQYYGIGEVAAMFQVNASLLRYWESEFDILKPRKNRKGDRFFRPDDIKNLQLIHHLLREKKYTIEGAREYLKKSRKGKEKFEAVETLKKIRQFLLELKAGLGS
jgi:DNA-binding transcriptional MerR regulator